MLSFICASNKPKVLKECVISSLEKQKDRDFELVVVDTTLKQYASAVEALNEGADRAKGDYFVFCIRIYNSKMKILSRGCVDILSVARFSSLA